MSERRASKRLKTKAATVPASDNDVDDHFLPEELSEASDFEDEPIKKARKKIGKISSSRQSKTTRKGKLSQLPEMPLDILFQIFSYLHPKDLISITRTNKLCRDTLLAPNAVSIWRAARRQYSAPDPLQDFSEPRWARLLFGGAICEICGTSGIKDPDFFLRRKACKSCLAERSIDDKNKSLKSLYHESILKLVPCTTTSTWRFPIRRTRRWWIDDLKSVTTRLCALEQAVQQGLEDAEANLEAYKQERLELVRSVDQQAGVCNKWFSNYREALYDEKCEKSLARLDAIEKKLIDLGYDKVDITSALTAPEARNGAPLTERIWTRIRSKLERVVQDARQERLREERLTAMWSAVDSLYKTYLKTISPKQWRHHPRTAQVCRFPEFVAVFEATDGDIIEDTFVSLVPQLPSMIETWQTDQRRRVLSTIVPSTCTCPICSNPLDSSLDLAAVVFSCSSWACDPFWFKDGHHCNVSHYKGDTDAVYRFSRPSHEMAIRVIREAGLNPDTATVDDMDRCEVLFVNLNGWNRKSVYTWRQMVHNASYHDTFKALSPEEKARVVYVEDQSIRQSWWTCAHCAAHLDSWKLHQEVAIHVNEAHGIDEPVTDEDIILGPAYHPCNFYTGKLPQDT